LVRPAASFGAGLKFALSLIAFHRLLIFAAVEGAARGRGHQGRKSVKSVKSMVFLLLPFFYFTLALLKSF
jgi:hypothetical protein